jgi:hypothetical protein
VTSAQELGMLTVPISDMPILPGHDSIKLALRRTAKNFRGRRFLGRIGGAAQSPSRFGRCDYRMGVPRTGEFVAGLS